MGFSAPMLAVHSLRGFARQCPAAPAPTFAASGPLQGEHQPWHPHVVRVGSAAWDLGRGLGSCVMGFGSASYLLRYTRASSTAFPHGARLGAFLDTAP